MSNKKLVVICKDIKQFNRYKKENPNNELIPCINENYEQLRGNNIDGFVFLHIPKDFQYLYSSILIPMMVASKGY